MVMAVVQEVCRLTVPVSIENLKPNNYRAVTVGESQREKGLFHTSRGKSYASLIFHTKREMSMVCLLYTSPSPRDS